MTTISNDSHAAETFTIHWQNATDDNNLTLHSFHRFKTTHLLNLRYLEEEIAKLDRIIYRAGLSLELDISPIDRLGLRYSKKDQDVTQIDNIINEELVLKLRSLISQYDDALIKFNQIMTMETCSLFDNGKLASSHPELSLPEIYNTRLLRTDLGPRIRTDPFQRFIHRHLRAFRYRRLSQRYQDSEGGLASFQEGSRWFYLDTVWMSELLGRTSTAVTTGFFLVVPLAVLSQDISRSFQLVAVSVCIVVFSVLVSVMLKASNLEVMVVSAAYAAVLSVFVSNTGTGD